MFCNLLNERKYRYRALLISLIAFVFILPILPSGPLGDILFGSLFLVIIILASFKLSSTLSVRWSMPLFGGLSLIFALAAQFNEQFDLFNRLAMFLFFCMAITIFSRDIFKERQPGIDHLFGSILIYFLIAIAYALAFIFFQDLNSQEFILADSGKSVKEPFDLYYFSFITLGTVGYGDIIAKGQFAKTLCMFESMTGLFYIAILVASLQGFFKSTTQPGINDQG